MEEFFDVTVDEPASALSGLGSFMGPLGSIGGALLGGMFGSSSAKKQNKAAAKLMREQMAWQERMASTMHQREVADLRAAGLNPILSATKGYGGTMPGNVSAAPVVDEGAAGRASAIAVQRAAAELELIKAQTAKTTAEAMTEAERPQNVREQSALANATQNLHQAQSGLVGGQSINEAIRGDILELERSLKEWEIKKQPAMVQSLQEQLDTLAAAAQEARNRNAVSETWFGQFLTTVNQISQALQGAAGAAHSAKSLRGSEATTESSSTFSKGNSHTVTTHRRR